MTLARVNKNVRTLEREIARQIGDSMRAQTAAVIIGKIDEHLRAIRAPFELSGRGKMTVDTDMFY